MIRTNNDGEIEKVTILLRLLRKTSNGWEKETILLGTQSCCYTETSVIDMTVRTTSPVNKYRMAYNDASSFKIFRFFVIFFIISIFLHLF